MSYSGEIETLVMIYEDHPDWRATALHMHREVEDGLCSFCKIHERPEYRAHATCVVAYTAAVANDKVARKRRAARAAAILAEHPDTQALPEEFPTWSTTNSPNAVSSVEPDAAVS